MKRLLGTAALAASLAFGPVIIGTAMAGDASSWTLSADESKIAYVSIKKESVGEVNYFEKISGTVSAEGDVTVNIDVTSVQTNIDIRNERMVAFVFDAAKPTATLTTKIDMAALEKLEPGATISVDVEGTLTLSGISVGIETSMFVARLSDKRVMVSTDDMIVVGTEDLGVTAGIDKLMELAKLPSITRVSPVSLRFVFTKDDQKAAVEPVAAPAEATKVATLSGDISKGKQVFKRCAACHDAKAEKNKVGPHLVNIVGRKAGSVEGYEYSAAMKGADVTWTADNIAEFVTKPKDFIKGTKMAFNGLNKPEQVQDLVAYLNSLGG